MSDRCKSKMILEDETNKISVQCSLDVHKDNKHIAIMQDKDKSAFVVW